VRRHTVVLNLDIIRCLVLWDRLIVVVPEGADSHCLDHLEENLRCIRAQQRAFDMDADEDDGACVGSGIEWVVVAWFGLPTTRTCVCGWLVFHG
jgi:hypothetical protein